MSTQAHLVMEVPEQSQDVGMAQVGLDLNLTPELVFHIRLHQLGLEQHLVEEASMWPGRISSASSVYELKLQLVCGLSYSWSAD